MASKRHVGEMSLATHAVTLEHLRDGDSNLSPLHTDLISSGYTPGFAGGLPEFDVSGSMLFEIPETYNQWNVALSKSRTG